MAVAKRLHKSLQQYDRRNVDVLGFSWISFRSLSKRDIPSVWSALVVWMERAPALTMQWGQRDFVHKIFSPNGWPSPCSQKYCWSGPVRISRYCRLICFLVKTVAVMINLSRITLSLNQVTHPKPRDLSQNLAVFIMKIISQPSTFQGTRHYSF